MAKIYLFQGPQKTYLTHTDRLVIGDSQDLDVDGEPKRKYVESGDILADIVHTRYISTYDDFVEANSDENVLVIVFNPVEIDLISNVIELSSNKRYVFNNTTITHTDAAQKIISCDQISNFSIEGSLTIVGTRENTNNLTESGLYINACTNFSIEGVVIRNCRYCGIEYLCTEILDEFRGNKGRFSNLSIIENQFPIFLEGRAEYNLFENVTVSGNARAVVIQGGNNNFSNCNIVDNVQGVQIISGTNHAHGAFSNCNINHNTEYNLLVQSVTLGQTFNGCHFYGDDNVGAGKIRLENSRGVSIQNGHIDTMIEVVDGASNGGNMISGNFIAGTYTTVTGTGLEKLFLKENYTGSGMWEENILSSVYVEASRSGSAQSLSTNDPLIFNTEQSDLQGAYDNTTGIFTAPYDGVYELSINAVLLGTGIVAATSYINVVKSGSTVCYLPVGFGGTIGIVSESINLTLSQGDIITFLNVLSGSGISLDITGSFLKIKRID